MRYYEVYVADPGYMKSDPLTYASESALEAGAIVLAPVKNRDFVGFVVREAPEPRFKTKPLSPIEPGLVLSETARKFFDWLQAYYPSGSGSLVRQFLPSTVAKLKPLKEVTTAENKVKLPPLTAQQQNVLKQMEKSKTKHFLLHGDTGSGKTRVYIERARAALTAGRSVLVLTPEIALTSQLARSFTDTFGARVIISHSALTPAQRRNIWLQAYAATEPVVIIGARSALFSPLKDIGLIVVDEAHEQAYKQEQSPRYLATRAASALAGIHQAELILGSATPLVADYFLAEAKNVPILRMTDPAITSQTTLTSTVIDQRDRSLFSRSAYLSDQLLDAITGVVNKQEQALIYLNRRGTARLVLCQNCGWQALCPHCDLPLTYHGDYHDMRCHSCSYKAAVPSQCPECGFTELIFRGAGTKAITAELERLFPNARVRRFDTDLADTERFERHYDAVKAGEVDILVGTQMLAKGLDLPKLALVGIVAADSSLNFPDYTAAERTYQLLYQVMGRVGRGHRNSKVIVQTFQPDNPVLQAALARDWQGFYARELLERDAFLFPPFCYLVKLTAARKTRAGAQNAADKLRIQLQQRGLRLDVNGPAPSFYEQTAGNYHWQLIIKVRDRGQLLKIIPLLPAGWTYDLDPINLL